MDCTGEYALTTSIAVEAETAQRADRMIGQKVSSEPGPTLICIGAMHGNEPAGMLALQRIFEKLDQENRPLRGEFLGLIGNRAALGAGQRFLDSDLNRHWHPARIQASIAGELQYSAAVENRELDEVRQQLVSAFSRARGPVYFLDLHTTSGDAPPFLVISDTLRNRKFALNFPVPIIVGLEEELEGTLSEYIGCMGHTTMGFEGGQHDDPASVDLCEAAIWIALATAGVLAREDIPELQPSRDRLQRLCRSLPRVMEVRFRHPIQPGDGFRMEPGFVSFQSIRKNQLLARDHEGEYRARENGRILMPLYQSQGEDGYFEVRAFSPFWLSISAKLRHLRLDRWIHWLPGVQRHEGSSDTLVINRRIARFFSLQLFHLLGYRRHRQTGNRLVMTRQQKDFIDPGDHCRLETPQPRR